MMAQKDKDLSQGHANGGHVNGGHVNGGFHPDDDDKVRDIELTNQHININFFFV